MFLRASPSSVKQAQQQRNHPERDLIDPIQKVVLLFPFVISMALKNREESVKGLMMLKLFVRKIHNGFKHSSGGSRLTSNDSIRFDGVEVLPEDVKQGHFAVIAVKGGEPKRFIVELDYLTDPAFMKLLEQEFGLQQKGVLSVPCQPEELQTIIGDRRRRRMSTEW